jgi:periplasmic protein CpxP/Spy
MKSIRKLLWPTLLAAGAVLTAGAGLSVASAADATATADASAPQAPGAHNWHHHRGPWRLLGKLNLSADQKQQVKDIMAAARPQMQSLHEQMHANISKLQQTKPTDPNYSSIASQVSQTHGSLSAQAFTQHAELRAQIFKVLTPEQQTQLATLEAQMGARKHGATPSAQ